MREKYKITVVHGESCSLYHVYDSDDDGDIIRTFSAPGMLYADVQAYARALNEAHDAMIHGACWACGQINQHSTQCEERRPQHRYFN